MRWPPAWLFPVNSLPLPKWQQTLQTGSPRGDTYKSNSDAWPLPGPSVYFCLSKKDLSLCVWSHYYLFLDFLGASNSEPKAWLFGCICDAVSPEQRGLMVSGWVPLLLQNLLFLLPLLHYSQSCWELTSVKSPKIYLEGKPIYCD